MTRERGPFFDCVLGVMVHFQRAEKQENNPPLYRLPENAFFGTLGSYSFTVNIMQPNTIRVKEQHPVLIHMIDLTII